MPLVAARRDSVPVQQVSEWHSLDGQPFFPPVVETTGNGWRGFAFGGIQYCRLAKRAMTGVRMWRAVARIGDELAETGRPVVRLVPKQWASGRANKVFSR